MVRFATFPLVGKKIKVLSAMIHNMLSNPFSPSREVQQGLKIKYCTIYERLEKLSVDEKNSKHLQKMLKQKKFENS